MKIGRIDRTLAGGVYPRRRAPIGADDLPIGVQLNLAVGARLLLQYDARSVRFLVDCDEPCLIRPRHHGGGWTYLNRAAENARREPHRRIRARSQFGPDGPRRSRGTLQRLAQRVLSHQAARLRNRCAAAHGGWVFLLPRELLLALDRLLLLLLSQQRLLLLLFQQRLLLLLLLRELPLTLDRLLLLLLPQRRLLAREGLLLLQPRLCLLRLSVRGLLHALRVRMVRARRIGIAGRAILRAQVEGKEQQQDRGR